MLLDGLVGGDACGRVGKCIEEGDAGSPAIQWHFWHLVLEAGMCIYRTKLPSLWTLFSVMPTPEDTNVVRARPFRVSAV